MERLAVKFNFRFVIRTAASIPVIISVVGIIAIAGNLHHANTL
jgi:hypothetical protein